ncbi:MAG TPA: N-acetyltransferase [Terriglobales bacterium]|nr:N-acetyltransferase [Terriglobales bacterium]
MLRLRLYRKGDFARLVKVDHACFPEGIAYPEEEMRSFLEMPSAITLIAADEKKIVGFVIADRFHSRRWSGVMGRIITIDVLPEAQGTGVGDKLLTTAEEKLRESGCDYVSLEVAVDNSRALRFYKKHGYSVLKTLPRYYLDSVDGLLMGKRLS